MQLPPGVNVQKGKVFTVTPTGCNKIVQPAAPARVCVFLICTILSLSRPKSGLPE